LRSFSRADCGPWFQIIIYDSSDNIIDYRLQDGNPNVNDVRTNINTLLLYKEVISYDRTKHNFIYKRTLQITTTDFKMYLKIKILIGCTRLRAVSGILRTQRGRRGSGLVEATCGYCLRWSGHAQPGQASLNQALASTPSPLRPHLSPLWLKSSPRGLPLAPVAQPLWLNSSLRRLPPLWLNSGWRRALPTSHWPWVSSRAARRRTATGWIADSTVYPLSPGRRRAAPTSHWPWMSSRAACRRAGSPARIATVVLAWVQWGGLRLALPEVDRRQHRVSRGPGDRWSRPSPVR
jgi:hypothetical protein